MNEPIIVIGGGPAGSTCARQLARLGHAVVLAERRDRFGPRIGETCGPRTRRLLEQECGLRLPDRLFRSLRTFYASWGSAELDGRDLMFWQAGDGLVLDRAAFDAWLLDEAEAAGVTVLRGCRITGGREGPEGWLLTGSIDGAAWEHPARFVVEAAGRTARSPLHADAGRLFADDLVCLSLELPEQPCDTAMAMIESCAVGWWYTARAPGLVQVLALLTDADLVGAAEDRADWLRSALSTTVHMQRLVGPLPAVGAVRAWDARTSARTLLWRRAWLSIGDAAWCLDPLSGAGIERAIGDGIASAGAVSQMVTHGDATQLRALALSRGEMLKRSLAVQKRYYSLESRWQDQPFWKRRAQVGPIPALPVGSPPHLETAMAPPVTS